MTEEYLNLGIEQLDNDNAEQALHSAKKPAANSPKPRINSSLPLRHYPHQSLEISANKANPFSVR